MISNTLRFEPTEYAKTSHILKASSIGQVAYSRIERAKEGMVYGVFDSAINLLFHGKLVSLVADSVERGPINVVLQLPVEACRMSLLGVRAGDKATVEAHAMKLNDRYRLSLRSAEIYSPKTTFSKPVLSRSEIEANIDVAVKVALEFGNLAGLGDLLTLFHSNEVGDLIRARDLNIFASSAFPRIVRLVRAVKLLKEDELRMAVRELIGLGPGLTPSSDDMLSALVLLLFLYSKNTNDDLQESRLVSWGISREVKSRTTRLSKEYLSQAAQGRGNESVTRLCEAILTGGVDAVHQETRRMLSIGETSGTDAVLGIVLGAMFCTGCNFFSLEKIVR